MDKAQHKVMQELINILLKKEISITSLTPSSFALKEQSIFCNLIMLIHLFDCDGVLLDSII